MVDGRHVDARVDGTRHEVVVDEVRRAVERRALREQRRHGVDDVAAVGGRDSLAQFGNRAADVVHRRGDREHRVLRADGLARAGVVAPALHEAAHGGAVLVLRVEAANLDVQRVAGLEVEGQRDRLAAFLAQAATVGGGEHGTAVVVAAADTERQLLGNDRAFEAGRNVALAVVGRRDVEPSGVLGQRGRARDVVDGAAEGAATVGRRLRTLDDLDAFDVIVGNGLRAAEHEDAVQEQRAQLQRGAVRVDVHAAEPDRRSEAAGDLPALLRVLHARRAARDILERGEALLLDVGCGERGDRERCIKQALFGLSRGNRDFFEDQRRPVRLAECRRGTQDSHQGSAQCQ